MLLAQQTCPFVTRATWNVIICEKQDAQLLFQTDSMAFRHTVVAVDVDLVVEC